MGVGRDAGTNARSPAHEQNHISLLTPLPQHATPPPLRLAPLKPALVWGMREEGVGGEVKDELEL